MNTARHVLPMLALLGLALAPAAQAQSYSFTNFDGPVNTTPGATLVSTTVNGISNSGLVVGFTSDNNGVFTNFAGVPGALTTLNLSGAANANAINTYRQVVGTDGAGGAFLLNSSTPTNTPQPLPPANATTTGEAAFGINDNGIIVGQYTDSKTGTMPGFVDTHGAFTTLNPVGNAQAVSAQGVNNNGLVTGFYNTTTDAVQHGFLFNTKTDVYTLLMDPMTAQTAGGNLALTQFLGINDSGQAVGYYQTKSNSQYGFLFNTATDQYTYLDSPTAAPFNGVQVTQITGINNAGEIAGFSINAAGVQQGFVATPVAAPVPETSSVVSLGLLLALGVGGAAWSARKRRAVR